MPGRPFNDDDRHDVLKKPNSLVGKQFLVTEGEEQYLIRVTRVSETEHDVFFLTMGTDGAVEMDIDEMEKILKSSVYFR